MAATVERSLFSFPAFCAVVSVFAALALALPASAQSSVQEKGKCRLLLPDVIYAAPGREANLYFENIVTSPVSGQYLFDVNGPKGMQLAKRWTWTPESEAGAFPLDVEVRGLDDTVLAKQSTTIRVAKRDAGAGKSIKLLCIGDSLTAASSYTGELLNLCSGPDNPKLTLLGTHQPYANSPLNRHEGYGGWTYSAFVSKWNPIPPAGSPASSNPSPFIFQEKDGVVLGFSRYIREKLQGQTPDYITIMLGVNDLFSATDENRNDYVEAMIANARTLVANIREAAPQAQIGIVTIVPPTDSQDAFGDNYGNSQTLWGYRKNIAQGNVRLMQVFGGREKENIWLVPTYVNLDMQHGFPAAEKAVNARSNLKTVQVNNSVHPDSSGYLQIADSIFAWLKCRLSE